MQAARFSLIGFILLFLGPLCAAGPLKYAVVTTHTQPLADITFVNGQYHINKDSGFLVQLGIEMSHALGMELELSTLSRQAVDKALLKGQVDIVCYLTPEWTTPIADSVDWSESFMRSNDILVSRSQTSSIMKTDDLRGMHIGLIKHYNYPLLNTLLESNQITPIYSSSEASNFMVLFKNQKADAIVLKELTYKWLSQNHSRLVSRMHTQIHPLIIQQVEPQCAVSRHKKLNLTMINQGIRNFKSKYGFDNQWRPYHLPVK